MDRTSPAVAAVVCLTVSALAGAGSARAQGADDRAAAEAIVRQLGPDMAHKAVTGEALDRTKAALERATRLRGSGDEAHAKVADGLAREWAETARDLARAADAEATAAEARRKAVEAQARLERARALVEEGIARVGRLKAGLEEAARPSKDRTAVEVHDDGPGSTKKNGVKDKASKAGAGGRP